MLSDLINNLTAVIRDGDDKEIAAARDALEAEHGFERASQLWATACTEVGPTAVAAVAIGELTAGLTAALRGVYDACEAALKLTDEGAVHPAYSDTGIGTDIHEHLEDAGRAIRAVQALHLQASGGAA